MSHLDLKSKLSWGCHFGTFPLTDEGIDEPLRDLDAAKTKLGVKADDFLAPENGESRVVRKD